MHQRRPLLALVSVALLAACGEDAGSANRAVPAVSAVSATATPPQQNTPSSTPPEPITSPTTTTISQPTTTPSTTTPSTTPTAAAASLAPDTLEVSDVVQLNDDGLAIVGFGDEPETVIAAVTAVLGEPTDDTGWSDPLVISSCAGTQVRRVSWGSLSLYFGDESAITDGALHLFGYSYGTTGDLEAEPRGLATPEGIGLGSTVEYLRAAYPDVVVEPGEADIIEPNFFVDATLSGRLTGGGDDDLVTVVIGGDACGV